MTPLQKYAWYNLAVIGLTILTMVILLPIGGKGALGAFGILGLIGFGPLFFRRLPGKVVLDERDEAISKRAWNVAFALFWAIGVAFASLVSAVVYGSEGAVPVWIVQSSVFVGLMVIYGMASVSILVQYGRGRVDAE